MNRVLPMALLTLMALCLLPVGGATHDTVEGEQRFDRNEFVAAHFEFDQTAARPPTDLEGVLVLETRSQAVALNGSITLLGRLAEVPEPADKEQDPGGIVIREPQSRGETLAHVDMELDSFSEVRIPFSIPLRGLGHGIVEFEAALEGGEEDGKRLRAGQALVYGVAPVQVSLDSPAPDAQLVSVPGHPAEIIVTLTALPGSHLTDLHLTGFQGNDLSEGVGVGDLAPGESRTVTLKVEADMGQGYRGLDHSAIIPQLHGFSDGEDFSHPLYRSVGARLEPIHPAVYIAPESTLFLIPPQDARLGKPATHDVVILNAGTKTIDASGQVTLSLPGMPHLDTIFDIDVRVGAGGVEIVTLEWTPPAAGLWQASVHHDVGRREPQREPIRVSGPIAGVDFQVPAPRLERGEPVTVSVVLTASQDLDVEGMFLTMVQAPQEGMISIDNMFHVQPAQATTLESDTPTTVEMGLIPRATGQHAMYLVVETPEGPSVHSVGTLTVTGSNGGWPMAWSPTLLVGLLVGLHISWRRWWVT